MEIQTFYLCLWGCIILATSLAAITEIPMDNTATSGCLGSKSLAFDDEVKLYSNGKARDGYFDVVFRAAGANPTECKYRYMCVSAQKLVMSKCVSKITLTGKKFNGDDDVQEIGCYNSFPSAWCTAADILHVAVTETQSYAFDKDIYYSFNLTVTNRCSDTVISTDSIGDDFEPASINEAVHETRVIGIIVAVCMASIFLVCMFTSYIYYRNKSNRGYSSQE